MEDQGHEVMLTTIDNPFNPFTQWESWLRFDRDNGYYTNEYLARVSGTSELLSSNQNLSALLEAMEDIVQNNPTRMWVYAYKPDTNNDNEKAHKIIKNKK